MKKFVDTKLNLTYINKDSSFIQEATLYSINFDNTYEMIDYINETPYVYPWKQVLASHDDSPNRAQWAESRNLEEAIELFKRGDAQNIDNLFHIKQEITDLMPYLSKIRTTKYYPYGTRPNVPRFLTNNPNCMYKLKREEIHNVVNIYYNVSSNYSTSKEAIEKRGMLTLALVDILEKLDYRVNLVFFDLTNCLNEYILIRFNIKDGLQSLDPNICFFPLCHPSYNRRIIPSIMEKCEIKNNDWTTSYGVPCTNITNLNEIFHLTDKDICITDFGGKFGKNSIVEDMEIFLKEIDFNKFLEEGKEMVYDKQEEKFVIKEKEYEPIVEVQDEPKKVNVYQKAKRGFGFRK